MTVAITEQRATAWTLCCFLLGYLLFRQYLECLVKLLFSDLSEEFFVLEVVVLLVVVIGVDHEILPDYVAGGASPERMLETVERFEEDLTDAVRVHRPLHAAVEVGEAIEVPPGRDRGSESDGLMTEVRRTIEAMLERLRARRPPVGTR